jgi:hypothetical protein
MQKPLAHSPVGDGPAVSLGLNRLVPLRNTALMQRADADSLRARLESEGAAYEHVVREAGPRDFEVLRIGIPTEAPNTSRPSAARFQTRRVG